MKELIIEALVISRNPRVISGLIEAYVAHSSGDMSQAKQVLRDTVVSQDYKRIGGAELAKLIEIIKYI